MTNAPAALAIWMAAVLTPLAAAWISTLSPIRTPPVSIRPCHAVIHTVGMTAASSNDTDAGMGWTFEAGTTTNSAYPPSRLPPTTSAASHLPSSATTQAAQWPQPIAGLTRTRSPTAISGPVTRSECGPTAATTPATSIPATCGRAYPGISAGPRRCSRSRWFSPQAFTAISTSPGPGSGVGASSMRSTSALPCS